MIIALNLSGNEVIPDPVNIELQVAAWTLEKHNTQIDGQVKKIQVKLAANSRFQSKQISCLQNDKVINLG